MSYRITHKRMRLQRRPKTLNKYKETNGINSVQSSPKSHHPLWLTLYMDNFGKLFYREWKIWDALTLVRVGLWISLVQTAWYPVRQYPVHPYPYPTPVYPACRDLFIQKEITLSIYLILAAVPGVARGVLKTLKTKNFNFEEKQF